MSVKTNLIVEVSVAPRAVERVSGEADFYVPIADIALSWAAVATPPHVGQQFTTLSAGSLLVHERHDFPYDVTVAVVEKEIDFQLRLRAGEQHIGLVL